MPSRSVMQYTAIYWRTYPGGSRLRDRNQEGVRFGHVLLLLSNHPSPNPICSPPHSVTTLFLLPPHSSTHPHLPLTPCAKLLVLVCVHWSVEPAACYLRCPPCHVLQSVTFCNSRKTCSQNACNAFNSVQP